MVQKMWRNKTKTQLKYNNHKIKQMKNNNYIEPTIDLFEMEVEQGIATSVYNQGLEDQIFDEITVEWS